MCSLGITHPLPTASLRDQMAELKWGGFTRGTTSLAGFIRLQRGAVTSRSNGAWFHIVPAVLLPGMWIPDPHSHTDKEETVSHLVVLWCCRPPPTKASQDTLGFLSCCHLDHAVIIKDIRCGHLSGLIASQRTRSTDLDLLVSWPLAEVAAASGAGQF